MIRHRHIILYVILASAQQGVGNYSNKDIRLSAKCKCIVTATYFSLQKINATGNCELSENYNSFLCSKAELHRLGACTSVGLKTTPTYLPSLWFDAKKMEVEFGGKHFGVLFNQKANFLQRLPVTHHIFSLA